MDWRVLKIYVVSFIVVFLLKLNTLFQPYFWDALNYVIPTSLWILEYKSLVYLSFLGMGHPPFLYLVLAFGFGIFSTSVVVAHVINLLFAAMAICFTYLLGEHLFSKRVGFVAAVLLLLTPLFFAQAGILLPEMTMTGLVVAAIYFGLKEKYFLYTLFGSALVLTKEPGMPIIVFFIAALFLVYRRKIIDCLKYVGPLIVFALWMLSNKLLYGWVIFPRYQANAVENPLLPILLKFFLILKTILFDNFHWILIALIIVFAVSYQYMLRRPKKQWFLALVLGIGSFVLIQIFVAVLTLVNLYTNLFSNLSTYLDILQLYSPLFALLLFFLVFSYKHIHTILTKKSYFLGLIVLLTLAMFALFPFSPRYILPVYPLFFIFLARGLDQVLKQKVLFVLFIMVLLFMTQYSGDSSDIGFTLDDNLEYLDMIEVHSQMASYIEENYNDVTVLTCFPQINELTIPEGGYVTESLDVVGRRPLVAISDYEYNNAVREEGSPENLDYYNVDFSDVDLMYYSEQQYPCDYYDEAITSLELEEVVSFEKNGKRTILYEVL